MEVSDSWKRGTSEWALGRQISQFYGKAMASSVGEGLTGQSWELPHVMRLRGGWMKLSHTGHHHNGPPALAPQAHQASMRRVGRGGLGEDEDFASAEARAGSSRDDGSRRGEQTTGVAYADVVHHPSEAEQILKLLAAQLRGLRRLPADAGEPVCACTCTRRCERPA